MGCQTDGVFRGKNIFKDQVSFDDTAKSFVWKNVSAVFKLKPEGVSLP